MYIEKDTKITSSKKIITVMSYSIHENMKERKLIQHRRSSQIHQPIRWMIMEDKKEWFLKSAWYSVEHHVLTSLLATKNCSFSFPWTLQTHNSFPLTFIYLFDHRGENTRAAVLINSRWKFSLACDPSREVDAQAYG